MFHLIFGTLMKTQFRLHSNYLHYEIPMKAVAFQPNQLLQGHFDTVPLLDLTSKPARLIRCKIQGVLQNPCLFFCTEVSMSPNVKPTFQLSDSTAVCVLFCFLITPQKTVPRPLASWKKKNKNEKKRKKKQQLLHLLTLLRLQIVHGEIQHLHKR